MSESHLMGFLVLLSILPTASTIGILKSINDLKKIPFGQSVPKHSLALLHWFANTIEIDNNDLIELTFEPNNGDYGTHHYGNFDGVLDPLPPGQQYYTLGNINPMINNNGNSLPSYVTGQRNHLLGREELNRARIIFSLLGQDTIDQVFITQHYHANQGLGTVYDPEHTYQITINLLRELREFSLDQNQQSELSEIGTNFGSAIDSDELSSIRNKFGQLACVGLLLFIVITEKNLPCRPNRARETKRPPKRNVGEPKLPPKQNVGEPKLPPKQNVGEPRRPPKLNNGTSATEYISLNIPENDYNHRQLNQVRHNDQCCPTACKICIGIIITIIIIIIIAITIITILYKSIT
ncbi:uncharacterized protein LOC132447909 isoform X1 [Gadus macrocephalus]|uniref:uncharacterized protein LOC132447909 isoform X1 n=1 Tax=Gadus macrocephalus TaxID=80720 RepID=UPI0028CB1751|nr:uncharacterized protein LOC132447909 isoform X1 [Gadus macrocephalus]XP_059894908.1 uncharacterized protein LOC132447909 isoform X1 [Gadus macrocephalus]XP_059894909.1 uncharacterized protein LOC132447909 isoform X1 [Gadus macrocephalus]